MGRAPARVGAAPWWVLAPALIVLLAVSWNVAHSGIITDLDRWISRRTAEWHLAQRSAKPAIYALTLPGQRGTVLAVTGPLICWFAWREHSVEPLIRYLIALVTLVAVVTSLKHGVPRVAPTAIPGQGAPTDSYPSGHLANAILVWTVVAASAITASVPGPVITVLHWVARLAPIAVVVGMTLLDYHWFSDFVGGACVGVLLIPVALAPWWAAVARRIDGRLSMVRR